MGYWKNFMIESHEDDEGNAIADALGISYYDLSLTTYEIEENISEEGVLYNYLIVFSEGSPKEVLKKIKGLQGNTVQIDISVLQGHYAADYEYEFEAIFSDSGLSNNFYQDIENLQKLNAVDLNNAELNKILKRQIYIGVIGSMETFLSETFIKLTLTTPANLERFVKSHPEFGNRRFDLKEVFDAYKNIEATAKSVMLDTIYHDLPKVREMYRSTFEIEFPSIKDCIKCVKVRHDLVHRNGKSKEGEITELDSDVINKTIDAVVTLIKAIVAAIAEKDLNIDFSELD